jgi:hypothetical protein
VVFDQFAVSFDAPPAASGPEEPEKTAKFAPTSESWAKAMRGYLKLPVKRVNIFWSNFWTDSGSLRSAWHANRWKDMAERYEHYLPKTAVYYAHFPRRCA